MISEDLKRRAAEAWGKPVGEEGGPPPVPARTPRRRPLAGREELTSHTNRLLHALAGKVYGQDAGHRELHRLAACLFGADHLADLSESQAGLLVGKLDGRLKRPIDPSPRRQGALRQLEALLARGGPACEEYVLAAAAKRFKADSLDDCGIGRLAALCHVAQYYLSR